VADRESHIPLSAKERELVRTVARRDGISEDEAASNLVKAALARRAKKRGGAARIYSIKRPR
jgi:hypothetical protein